MSALVDAPSSFSAVEQRHAVRDRDELDVAAAFGLERLLDLRAGPPFGGEALIGIDGEFLLRGRRKGQSGQRQGDQGQKSRAHQRLLRSC